MSATHSTRRTISFLGAIIFLTTVASALIENAPSSSPQPTFPQPILIVWAHTDLAQDDPSKVEAPDHEVLNPDLPDLANSFAAQLAAWGVQNVLIADDPRAKNLASTPNAYILELTVEASYSAERQRWNDDSGRFDHSPTIGAELALRVRHIQNGFAIGETAERSEYDFPSDSEAKEVEVRRGAIYAVAQRLAEDFVEAWAAGLFEPDLPASQAPTFYRRLSRTLDFNGLTIPALVLVLGFAAILFGFISGVSYRRHIHANDEEWSRLKQAHTHDIQAQVDEEVRAALTLALKTDNFSDAACRGAAAANHNAVLAAHADIASKEAERRLTAKSRTARHEHVAARASDRSKLDRAAIVNVLQQADEWEFRVLQEAKKLAVEVSSR